MVKYLFSCSFIVVWVLTTQAQPPTLSPLSDIPVVQEGNKLALPWAGGFNNPQFSRADLNQDGLEDLFVFDRSGNHPITFVNQGINDSAAYKYAPSLSRYFPSMIEWALLRDFNCDGVTDIMTSDPGSIRFYEGSYTNDSLLTFTNRDSLIFNGFNGPVNIYASRNGIPAITDINGDGDLDVLAFPNFGATLNYYENQSMETQGNCAGDDLFKLASDCWGIFQEAGASSAELLDNCDSAFLAKPSTNAAARQNRHSGSTLLAYDQQNDGVQDLMIGNISFNNLIYLSNGGTTDSAKIVSQDTTFPSYDKPVDVATFPAPFHLDVDNDGRKDLLVAPNARGDEARSRACSWFYKNNGTEDSAHFTFQTDSFLVGEMIDLGKGAHPSVVDYNNDSLPDLVVGNYGYYDTSGSAVASLTLLENIGTRQEPAFEVVERNLAGLKQQLPANVHSLHPTFGDLDNDSDMDMIMGNSEGELQYYENTAGAGNPISLTLNASVVANSNVGSHSTPFLYDVNDDGPLDLIVGERNGNLNYFQNKGTPSSPSFQAAATDDFFGGVDTRDPNDFSGFSSPVITTLDTTGQPYLLSGNKNGHIYIYQFLQDSVSGGTFPLIDEYYSNIRLGRRSHPKAADLNHDDTTELVIGNWRGGLGVYGQGPEDEPIDTNVDITPSSGGQNSITLYPNPASDIVTLRFDQTSSSAINKVTVYDVTGTKMVAKSVGENGQQQLQFHVEEWPTGVYFCTVDTENGAIAEKLIVTEE